jgi:hypothetical protein
VLQLKDFRKRGVSNKVTALDVKILVELEGPLGGRALFAGHGDIVPNSRSDYSILVPYVNDYL